MSNPSPDAIARLTLRHWTTDSRFVGGSERPAPTPSFTEEVPSGRFRQLASKLAQVKAELKNPRA